MESSRARRVLAAAVLLAILSSSYAGNPMHPGTMRVAGQTAASAGPAFLEIGFGPDTLSPASLGAPIFTVNDSMWIFSLLSQSISISLKDPGGNLDFASDLSSASAESIHVFTASDPQGLWNLTVSLQNGSFYSLAVPFVEPALNNSIVSLTEYSIQNGQINLGFASNAGDAYNLEACLSSSFGNGSAYLQLPSSFGSGQVALNLDAGPGEATFIMPSSPTQPFSFWFDLYYSYGFRGPLSNETISRDLVATKSSTAYVNGTGSQLLSLSTETRLRPGRYTLRSTFDSGSNLASEETSLLLLSNGNWFWLGGCSPFTVTQNGFTKQVSLDQDPSTWPRFVYVAYDVEGVESYSINSLQINLARIDFFGTPNNVKLSYLTYTIANNSDAQASGVYAGTIYVIAKAFPIVLTITPVFGAQALAPQTIQISQAFTDSLAYIPVGELSVRVLNNSRPDTGSQVKIVSPQGATLANPVDSSGVASFYLPPGPYNITVSNGAISEAGNATVVSGNETIVDFSFTSAALPGYFVQLLAVPLVLGLILNLWIWIVAPRRAKYRL